MNITPQPMPERKKRNVFVDLRKHLGDINVRATRDAFQSANFIEGETGWRLNANGLFEATRIKLDNFIPYSNSAIDFTGTWAEETVNILYGGGRKVSSTIGDTFTITFTGSSIGLIMEKGGSMGKFYASVDGGEETLVDLYVNAIVSRTVVYQQTGLSNSEHVLTVTVATKNASSSANNVGVQGYVKSPTDGIRLEDISADLYATSYATQTNGNGYVKSTTTGTPSGWIMWGIMGFILAEGDMSDATLTDPMLCNSTNAFYMYNGAASTTYVNTRVILISKIAT